MGNLKAVFAEGDAVVEKNIQIEDAGTAGNACGAVAAEAAFDGEECVEEIARGETSFERDDGVEEAGLIGDADGSGGVERGASRDAAERSEALSGCGDR